MHEWTKKAKRDLIHLVQPLISIQQAEDAISQHLYRLDHESIVIDQACGRFLAAEICADRPIPPYDRAMMDGIAISYQAYAEGTRNFPIAGIQAAGQPATALPNTNQCLEIMTGAVTPLGADCVIKIEDLHIEKEIAHLLPSASASLGQHIHPMGSDQKQGNTIIPAQTTLGPAEIAIAASVGQTQLSVVRIPKILLITTGDEVIPPQETPLQHQIRRSHASAISSSISSHQLGRIDNVHVPDTSEALAKSLKSAIGEYDIILLTGGISMGKYDYVEPVMNSLVGKAAFHGIAQRPGKPFAFWPGETPVFALPGNPASVMACLARYVLPALRQMRGETWQPNLYSLASDVTWNAPFPGLLASRLSNSEVHAKPPRNSGDYTALAGSQGICELSSTAPATTLVSFYPW